jgi:peptidoglycan/LPS O-acetylase OafA/YrhL
VAYQWYLGLGIGCAIATAFVGRAKGSSFFLWLLIGLVLPVIGLAAALLYRFEQVEPERRCPRCGRVVKLYVQVCPTCGEDLYLPEPSEVNHPNV